MKSYFFSTNLIAATLFLLPLARADNTVATATGPALADPATTPATPAPSTDRKERDAELLKKYDKNGDGKIDEDERAAAKADMMKNGTGNRANAFRERMIKRFDKNGDGVLDETELAAAIDAIKSNPRFIQRFDKNGDGKLDDSELAAARQEIGQRAAKARAAKTTKS